MKIALDATGGDHAPESNVKGALLALQQIESGCDEVEVTLVGQKSNIVKFLPDKLPTGLKFLDIKSDRAIPGVQPAFIKPTTLASGVRQFHLMTIGTLSQRCWFEMMVTTSFVPSSAGCLSFWNCHLIYYVNLMVVFSVSLKGLHSSQSFSSLTFARFFVQIDTTCGTQTLTVFHAKIPDRYRQK